MKWNAKLVKFEGLATTRNWSIRYGLFWYTYHDFKCKGFTWGQKNQFFIDNCLTTEEVARTVWNLIKEKATVVES